MTRIRERVVLGAVIVGAVFMVAGCGPMPPASGPDRSERVTVEGGSCEISWWLGAAVDDPPREAIDVAREALDDAVAEDSQLSSWYELLVGDPDNTDVSEIRLRGSAYSEAVREDVRDALDVAGYPDAERVVEVYSRVSCA